MRQNVIGGEFLIDIGSLRGDFDCEIPDDSSILFSLGRTSLYSVLKSVKSVINTDSVLLPDYCFRSIVQSVCDAGYRTCFYHIEETLIPDLDDLLLQIREHQVVLLINYFGLLDLRDVVEHCRERNPDIFIIEDDVQNFYRYGVGNVDVSFDSFRKWFPVPDGSRVIVNSRRGLKLTSYNNEAKYCQYYFKVVFGNL